MQPTLPPCWSSRLASELSRPSFADLQAFVARERQQHEVYPPPKDVFAAFQLTPFDAVRVVLLGQDPYHDRGQAHGLCFSVARGVKLPPSLKNIFQELKADIGCDIPTQGNLAPWARQGVLLLNTVLTVRAHQPHSHRGRGWEQFTDAVIDQLCDRSEPVVFVLWGGAAQKKKPRLNLDRHTAFCAAHPSPLSAHRGFFGSRPFSAINGWLRNRGLPQIDWCLAET